MPSLAIFAKEKYANANRCLSQNAINVTTSTPLLLASASPSVLSPPVSAGHALVEARHGLIGTANLDLEEGGLVAVAALVGALHAALLRIVPGARSAKDILLLLALEGAAREDGLRDVVLEGARPALEAVRALGGVRHG